MPRRSPAPGDHYNSVRDPASPGTSASGTSGGTSGSGTSGGTSGSARERRPPHGKPRATGAVSEATSPEAEAAAGAEAGGLSETMDGLRLDAPREGGGGSDGGDGAGGGGEDEGGADGEGGDEGGGDEAPLSRKQDRAKLKEEKRLRKEERHKRRAASEKAESEETPTRTDWSSAVISL